LSITQATEFGTIYGVSEIAELSAIARAHSLLVHMDGARFANALVTLGVSPAAMTWQNGVDMLSFGGTKNGAMLAEAVVVFKPSLAVDLPYLRKRAGQLASKQRYISVQLLALLRNDLWRKNALNANLQAQKLASGFAKIAGVQILFPVQANEIFVQMPPQLAEKLLAKAHYFYPWRELGENIYRLVTNWSTTEAEITQFFDDAVSA
jgi:threonine aldolase